MPELFLHPCIHKGEAVSPSVLVLGRYRVGLPAAVLAPHPIYHLIWHPKLNLASDM